MDSDDDPARFAALMADILELPLDIAARVRIGEHLATARAMAALLRAADIDEHREPAPVFVA